MLFLGTVGDVIFVADPGYTEIYISSLSPSDATIVPLPFKNLMDPIGVDFHPFDEQVYWTDYTRGTVERSSVDGRNQEIVRSSIAGPRGIALDLVGGNVYWISRANLTIEVSKLNGDYWKVLVSNLSSLPEDIALDTTRG